MKENILRRLFELEDAVNELKVIGKGKSKSKPKDENMNIYI